MAGSCVHVFMSLHSDARLDSFGYKIQASEPCMEIVSQLQRIFSYPTGQGAALQTNLPPSISLCDWQPGIWLQTKSVNSIRVCEMHILHMEKLWIRAAPQSLTRHFTRCTSPCSSFLIRHGLKWSRKGWIECRSDALPTSALQSEMLPRKTGCRVTDWRGDRKSEGYSVSIKSRILKTFDGLRLLCLRNNPSSCNGVLRWHATVLISPDEHLQLHCSSAVIWVLDKTTWSTLVTLEIRIREISWQAIWEQSNQVSQNSVRRPKGERDHAVSSALLSSTRWMASCHSRCAQNLNSK